MRLIYLTAEGVYRTADGRYQIEHGDVSVGFCECPEHLCRHPEGEVYRRGWWVWDNLHDDYAFGHETWDTMREARARLAALYEQEPNQIPKRRVIFPRPSKGETTNGTLPL